MLVEESNNLKYEFLKEMKSKKISTENLRSYEDKFKNLFEIILDAIDLIGANQVNSIEYSMLFSEKFWIERFLNKYSLFSSCFIDEKKFQNEVEGMLIK